MGTGDRTRTRVGDPRRYLTGAREILVGDGWWCSSGIDRKNNEVSQCYVAKADCEAFLQVNAKSGYEMRDCVQQASAACMKQLAKLDGRRRDFCFPLLSDRHRMQHDVIAYRDEDYRVTQACGAVTYTPNQ